MGWIHYLSGEDDTAVKYYLEKAKKVNWTMNSELYHVSFSFA